MNHPQSCISQCDEVEGEVSGQWQLRKEYEWSLY
jgi:hypothetical protein